MRNNINPEILRQLLRYEPETGKLYWLSRPQSMFPSERTWKSWNTRCAGGPALEFTMDNGYLIGGILGKTYLAHRVIWALVHGAWPSAEVDHINGVRNDNRIANLRAVTRTENGRNVCRRKNNTSGVTGVSFDNERNKWCARIRVNYRVCMLGRFDTFDAAVAARRAAEQRYGFHENHGREKAAA